MMEIQAVAKVTLFTIFKIRIDFRWKQFIMVGYTEIGYEVFYSI